MSDYTNLPASVMRLADSIGWRVAFALVKHFPSRQLHVPTKMTEEHILAQRLGMAGALALVKLCGGQTIYMPGKKEYVRQCRNARIVQACAEGCSVPELATRFDLSDRQIWTILGEPAPTEQEQQVMARQLSLLEDA